MEANSSFVESARCTGMLNLCRLVWLLKSYPNILQVIKNLNQNQYSLKLTVLLKRGTSHLGTKIITSQSFL